jgi:hypothetical protein
MAEKSRVKDVAVSCGTGPDVAELLVVEDELPHAAARRPRVQTPDVKTNFPAICLKETTLFIGGLAAVR